MAVLVTGATGKVGLHLVKKLVEDGEEVYALVKDKSKAGLLHKDVNLKFGRITDFTSVQNAVKGIDVVYHLAALVLGYSMANKEELNKVNVNGTELLLKACAEERIKHFVYASSIAVYGDKPAELPVKETTECRPTTEYGKTKLMGEQLVGRYAHDFTSSSLRISIVYGHGFERAYFPLLELLERGKMQILGSGENRLPFVHVSDVVEGLILSSKIRHRNAVYNIAEQESATQKKVFSLAARELGVSEPKGRMTPWLAKLLIRANNFWGSLRGKKPKILPEYIDQLTSDRFFDISKARKELGYEPKVGIEEGIKEVVSYYLQSKKL